MNDHFKDKAEDWDRRDMQRQLSTRIGACIVDNVELHRGMEVMDFGAGTGLITAQVADKVGRVTAVDVSEAMLAKLAAKPELQGKVDVVCRSIIDEPLDRQFDLIVSAMAMHHVEDTGLMVQCFAEHLRPGARVALADLDAEDGNFHPEGTHGVYHSGFHRDAFQRVLAEHGFSDITFLTATTIDKEGRPYPVFVAFATKSAA